MVWVSSSIPGDINATGGNAPWTTRNNTCIPMPGIHRDCMICNPETSARHTGPSSMRYGRTAGSGCTRSNGRGTDTPTAGDTRDTGRPSGRHHGHDDSRRWWAGTYRHRHGTPARAGPPRAGYSGIGTYLEKLVPSILDPGTVLSV